MSIRTCFKLDRPGFSLDVDLERRPDQLSGGERQRVGIARALAVKPRLLLMDEPLAALDLARKQEILPYLERLHEELEIPVLYVSHAPDEVARLADHIVVMRDGRWAIDRDAGKGRSADSSRRRRWCCARCCG